jgi:hypothetical protein
MVLLAAPRSPGRGELPVDELLLEEVPDDGRERHTHRVTGVLAHLTDARGRDRERVEIRARRVVLAAGPFSSPRILMRSTVPGQVRSSVRGWPSLKGWDRAVGADAVLAQAHREALMRHADDDETDAGPGIEPVVDEAQLRRVVAHEHRGERGAEAAAAGVEAADHGRVPRTTAISAHT